MIENKALAELEQTLIDVINAHVDNESVSYAELTGVLIMLAIDTTLERNKCNHEDEDED